MTRLLPLILLMAMGGGSASATSLATLVAGGTIQVGNKQFSNFSLSGATSGVVANAIDVVAFTDAGGNTGLRFTTNALSITVGGSNELIADVFFDVTTTSGFVIGSVQQAFAISPLLPLTGTIAAYDFTSTGVPPVVVASRCEAGVVGGCVPNALTDSHTFPGNTTSLHVERQVQLIRTKGNTASGRVDSFDATFGESALAPPPTVAVTVTTNPAGLSISVDGAALTAPQTFSWTPGSSHTIATTSPQGVGTRQAFSSWSDGGAVSHTITAPAAATTYTAGFSTQYLLTTAVSPAAGGSLAVNPASAGGYYASGTSVQLTATANAGNQFSNWSGDLTGATNPQTVIMSAPRTVTANFGAQTAVTVATNPTGLSISVDGVNLTAPQSFNWVPGSSHTIATTSPQGVGTRQAFASWSDGGVASHTVTAPAAATTYTASFSTQYLLTTAASPAAGGSLAVTPASADGYYASGTSVQLTATANAGSQFSNWSGDMTGATNPQSVVMSAPRTVTANFGAQTAVTVTTNPAGLSISVDGAPFTAPQSFNWVPGSSHTIATTSPQGAGTRQVFANWSDGGAASHTVTAPASAATYTATFSTQYLLTTAASPTAGGSLAVSPASADGYYAGGTSVQLTATANAGSQFSNWSGDLAGTTNPQSVSMSAPRTVTANFNALSGVTVTTNPPGLSISVDGAPFTAPQSFNWLPGSNHTIATTSPQGAGGTRQVFANWSDGGAASHAVTAPASAATFTATFSTQYLLTTAASPTAGGSLAVSPASADGYYASGTSVQFTATANPGSQFINWSGDLAGTTNPQSVSMSAPRTVTANFNALSGVTVTTNPPGLSISVDGVTVNAPQSFNWTPGSSHTIAATTPQGAGGTRQVFANWSDGGAASHAVTAPASAATYTATFSTQYLLVSAASPATGGSLTVTPASADGYYASGTSVQFTATANPGSQFINWSGDLTGATTPRSLVMSAPRIVTANFSVLAGVTITTNPPGLAISVDGVVLAAPQSFNWPAGSSHTIAATTPQGIGGTRQVFASWSDGGTASHTVTAPAAATTYTANFSIQYLLTAAASPSAAGSLAVSPASADGYYASGTSVQLTATPNAGYQFSNWSGDLTGATNPQPVIMSAPRSVTANFSSARGVTVATNPPGLTISVDGATLIAPQSFNWAAGSSHLIGVGSRQFDTGTRFTMLNWSDGGSAIHTITASSGAATYTANFTTEYLLTAVTAPVAGGTVTATPPSADGYYPAGVSVQLAAQPAAGYQFGGWTGALSGSANPQARSLTGPLGVTANFTAIRTEPTVAAVTRGASYKPGAVSPGLIVTVWGDRMGPAQIGVAALTPEGKFPTALAGSRVLFDGVPGAMLFTTQQQVSAIVPYDVDGKTSVQLELEYNGQRSRPYQLDVTDAAPGIFSADATGAGPGAILNLHDDGTVALNTAQEPAPRGSYISVYMTGEGQTDPRGVDGSVALTVLPRPLLKVSATIGGVPATVQYAGGAAYMVAGAMQVNLMVPPDAPAGAAVPLVIQVGDKQSQAGITVAIGN